MRIFPDHWQCIPLATIFSTFALASLASTSTTEVSSIYEFPDTPQRSIENIAVRANGQLLLNTITTPATYLLDPEEESPQIHILHTYPGANASVGIAETAPDVFAVVVGNYSNYRGVKGSFSIWTVDLRDGIPGTATKITSIPQAESLNGATVVPGTQDLILVADSALGAIWSVNVTTGEHCLVIQDKLLEPSESFPLGVNGIHVRNSSLHFTNSAQSIYGMIPITGQGTATGPIENLGTPLTASHTYDDFTFGVEGNVYLATQPNAISRISPSGSQILVAGNDTSIDGPTSVAFGRGSIAQECILYVTTSGSSKIPPGSGQVMAVDTCKL